MPLICCLGVFFIVYVAWWLRSARSVDASVRDLEIPSDARAAPSKGERLVGQALSAMGLPYSREFSLSDPRIAHKRFDVTFERELVSTKRRAVQRVMVEYDGEPHFVYSPYLHKTVESFESYRASDALKQQVAVELDCLVIRLHYSVDNVHLVRGHIEKALAKKRAYVYYSHPEHYKHLCSSTSSSC